MGAIKDLWESERGLVAIVVIVAATVIACFGYTTFESWQEFVKWIFGIYVTGKTITGGIALAKGQGSAPADPAPVDKPIIQA